MATTRGAAPGDRAGDDEDVVAVDPLNVETSWGGLRSRRTPTSEFFTRNHGAVPVLDPAAWRLRVEGARTIEISLASLKAMPARTLDVVLECAGNGRSFFDPPAEGMPWRERAVGCATFSGVPLRHVLERAGVPEDAVEIVFRGADAGETGFERALPIDVARAEDTLVAWEMNDAPLLPRHGAPVRLVVPSWYGVASVKWLVSARATATHFSGPFQTERYVYARAAGDASAAPVREKRVNSIVAAPRPSAVLPAGQPVRVTGWAWSGAAEVTRVEVSVDGGASWRDAQVDPAAETHAWSAWSATFETEEGTMTILSRAHDASGASQPDRPAWNALGYGYNAPRPRKVRVAARQVA